MRNTPRFGVIVVVRKLETSDLGSWIEISVKVTKTAVSLVASRPDPEHLSVPLRARTSSLFSCNNAFDCPY